MTGTVYVNNGKWYYMVKLPGELKRKAHPLCAPGTDTAMDASRPRELAIQAAWRFWEEHTKRTPSTVIKAKTVKEICSAYLEHAKTYYRKPDNTLTTEFTNLPYALRALLSMYGSQPVTALTHADMIRVRDMIASWGTCSRSTVNAYMNRVRRMWGWALDEGYINAQLKSELTQVKNLKQNRTKLREPVPVTAVPDNDVEAVCRIAPQNFADMVRVNRLTGMRPEEICAMKWEEIDTSSEPWVYRPSWHKNKWRGHPRAILIGPKARKILSRWKGDGFVFSPFKIIESGFLGRHEEYASLPRKNRIDCWVTETYGHAIRTYCYRAGITRWSPNRLRHSFATDIRREYGIVVAGCLLGHSLGMRVTAGYSFESAVDEIVKTGKTAIETLG